MEKMRLRACALIIENDAILLVEFKNDNDDGVHYNLTAGGLEPGETLIEAAIREAKEEACIEIEVGPVAFVYEYQPTKNNYIYGDTHSVGVTLNVSSKQAHILNSLKIQTLAKLVSSGFLFRSYIPFNCIPRLMRTLLIIMTVAIIAIMLRNTKFNGVSHCANGDDR